MEFKISSSVKLAYPDLKVSVVEVMIADKPEFNQEINGLKKKIENNIRTDYANFGNSTRVKKYNSFYKKFDSKVPMEFQIKSILNNKEIPVINPVLTCMFMAELKNIVLTAAHDLDKLGDVIVVSLSNGTEEYTKINEKAQKLKINDVFAADSSGIISSVLYGPDSRTKIASETKNFLFMCYSFGLDNEEVESHMSDIIGYLRILAQDGLDVKPVRIF